MLIRKKYIIYIKSYIFKNKTIYSKETNQKYKQVKQKQFAIKKPTNYRTFQRNA